MYSILLLGFVVDKTKCVRVAHYKRYEILGYCLLDYKSSKTKYVTRKGLSDWINSPEFSVLYKVERYCALLGIEDILEYKYAAYSSKHDYTTLLKTGDDIDLDEDSKGYLDWVEATKINLFDISGGIEVLGNELFCLSDITFTIFNRSLRLYAYYNVNSRKKFLSTLRFCSPTFFFESSIGSGWYDTLCELGFEDVYKRLCDEMVAFTLVSYTLVFVCNLDTLVLDREVTKYSIVADNWRDLTIVLHDRLEYLNLNGCYNCTMVSSRHSNLSILADLIRSIYLNDLIRRLEGGTVSLEEHKEKISLWKDLLHKKITEVYWMLSIEMRYRTCLIALLVRIKRWILEVYV